VAGNVDAGLAGTERARRIASAVPFCANASEFLTGSDAILNLGRRLAKKMATLRMLHSFELPLKVPSFEIAMLWNRRNTLSQARSWPRKLKNDAQVMTIHARGDKPHHYRSRYRQGDGFLSCA